MASYVERGYCASAISRHRPHEHGRHGQSSAVEFYPLSPQGEEIVDVVTFRHTKFDTQWHKVSPNSKSQNKTNDLLL